MIHRSYIYIYRSYIIYIYIYHPCYFCDPKKLDAEVSPFCSPVIFRWPRRSPLRMKIASASTPHCQRPTWWPCGAPRTWLRRKTQIFPGFFGGFFEHQLLQMCYLKRSKGRVYMGQKKRSMTSSSLKESHYVGLKPDLHSLKPYFSSRIYCIFELKKTWMFLLFLGQSRGAWAS